MAGAVGTAVVKRTKWHCHCLLVNGKEAFIAVKAQTAAEASKKAHDGYAVEYVLDILTHDQMERKKGHLRRSIIGTVSNY